MSPTMTATEVGELISAGKDPKHQARVAREWWRAGRLPPPLNPDQARNHIWSRAVIDRWVAGEWAPPLSPKPWLKAVSS